MRIKREDDEPVQEKDLKVQLPVAHAMYLNEQRILTGVTMAQQVALALEGFFEEIARVEAEGLVMENDDLQDLAVPEALANYTDVAPDERREVKVRLPAGLILLLHKIKLFRGKPISLSVRQALDLHWSKQASSEGEMEAPVHAASSDA